MSKILLGLVGETNINRPEPVTAFRNVREILQKADVLFGHFETTLSDNPSDNDDMPDLPFKRGWLHSKPINASAWKDSGFDAVGVASNVCGDTGSILRTIQEFETLGLPYTGIGRNIDEARRPVIIEKNGVKTGFLSYTSVFYPQFVPALRNRPGAVTIKAEMSIVPSWRSVEMPGAAPTVMTWLDEKEKLRMLDDVAALRTQVDHLVMSCHWGVSNAENVQDYQIELAHCAIDAGVDVIIGHHPHCPQAIEIYKQKPIFYSMGNFAFDWWFVRNMLKEGIMAYVTLSGSSVLKVSFIPVRREDDSNDVAVVSPDSESGISIVETIKKLSAPFKTKLEISGSEVIVTV